MAKVYGYKCMDCKKKQVLEKKLEKKVCSYCKGKLKMKVLEKKEEPKPKKTKEEKAKIPKEVLEKVLYLDLREEGNKEKLQKFLKKLPVTKDIDDLSTDGLETLIKKIELEHMVHLAYVMRSVIDGQDHYSGMIKTEAGDTKGEWVQTIYGQTFWEVTAKSLFFMYYHITNRRVRKGVK